MQRHNLFYSDRIKITENMIKKLSFDSVLEIGAGDYSFDYLKKGEGYWVKIDISAPCDVICDFNLDNLILPFNEKVFNLIICTEVLEHTLWPQQLLKEVNRVLSNEGKLVLSVPNIASLSYRIAWLFGHIPSCAATGNFPLELGSTAYQRTSDHVLGGHVIDFNLKRIVSLLQHMGFKVVSVKGSGVIWHRQILPHWIIPPSLSSNIICVATK